MKRSHDNAPRLFASPLEIASLPCTRSHGPNVAGDVPGLARVALTDVAYKADMVDVSVSSSYLPGRRLGMPPSLALLSMWTGESLNASVDVRAAFARAWAEFENVKQTRVTRARVGFTQQVHMSVCF